jgi:Uncharacterised nucleotidyltransferase
VRKRGLTGSFWPTDQQEALLRAALLPGDTGVSAWRAVRGSLDIDRLEEGSYSLLPPVYRQLQDDGEPEPLLPRLRGIYRHTWSKNQVLLQDLRAVVDKLVHADVRPLVVGGAARLPYYAEPGLRTLTEFELLVAERDVEPALRAVGWSGDEVPARVVRGRSTLRVAVAGHRPFGLHWRLLPEYPGPEEAWWAAARDVELEGVDALALAPADELLHACAGGARTALWANVQWVADATMILRSAEVDWDRFTAMAEEWRAALRLREALGYLVELLGAPVPAEVLERLERFPVTRRDVIAHTVSGSGGRVLGELPRTLAGYIRSSNGPVRSALGLPGYLRDAWNIERRWQLPLVAARKGAANLAARAARRRRH